MAGVIISGESHREVFADKLPPVKTHIVPNFALDELYSTKESVEENFTDLRQIRLLYISNMIDKKGYLVLTRAFLSLPPEIRSAFKLDLAGRFELESQKEEFIALIEGQSDITYHGIIDADEKIRMFRKAHVFCLPTSYFEGQPVSILEAYASGNIVLTTPQSGILDIFDPQKNGFVVTPDSAESIASALKQISGMTERLKPIALNNLDEAIIKYKPSTYNSNLLKIMEQSLEQ
jgi:glycosyltransferase involved in cell wall biosynthesis